MPFAPCCRALSSSEPLSRADFSSLTRVNQFSYIIRQSRSSRSSVATIYFIRFNFAMLLCHILRTTFIILFPPHRSRERLESRGKRFTCFIVGPVSLSTRKVIISPSQRDVHNAESRERQARKVRTITTDSFFSSSIIVMSSVIWWQSMNLFCSKYGTWNCLKLEQAKVSVACSRFHHVHAILNCFSTLEPVFSSHCFHLLNGRIYVKWDPRFRTFAGCWLGWAHVHSWVWNKIKFTTRDLTVFFWGTNAMAKSS